MNPVRLVFADMRRSLGGVMAVIVLVGVAVALGVAVTAQERALRQGSARAAEAFDLVVGARGSETQLILSTVYLQPALLELMPGGVLKRLAGEEGAVWVAPIVLGDSYEGLPIVGSTSDLITSGGKRRLDEGHMFVSRHEVVVGADVPLALGASFEPAHGLPGPRAESGDVHHGAPYVVVGRMARLGTPWDRAIVAPVEALWTVHARGTGHSAGSARIGPPWDAHEVSGVSAIVVRPRSVADAYRLRGRYRSDASMAVFPAEVLVAIYAILGDARDLLAIISLATQVLVLAAILLAVLASLSQRRRQLAVLRALGAPRAYLFLAVWIHVTVLIAAGAALGLLLGWAGTLGLSNALHAKTGMALPVAMTWSEAALTVGLVGLGAILALIPAWWSYRQPVAEALRS